ncbi:MAG: A/G-specific adenine glycosylase [Desulfomonilia bacterium]
MGLDSTVPGDEGVPRSMICTPEAISPGMIRGFRDLVYHYYREQGRTFPWRETTDPYRILVSEIMLQQTQTERVIPKYLEFLDAYPDFPTLARAQKRSVLALWKGLGYNRRALVLLEIAQKVMEDCSGRLPASREELLSFPGIGPSTAGAIMAFAHNVPEVFIETNIRRVYIHVFFPGQEGIRDREILPLVDVTLDRDNPRQWYTALMDYGVMLRKRTDNPNRRSAHYARQGAFEHSTRQIRGRILAALLEKSPREGDDLARGIGADPRRVGEIITALETEGFITRRGKKIDLA